ncbi:TPA: glyoxylate carboligase, partial [Escherichia coli]
MAKMRAVDAAMYVLEKEGITTAFGVPGAAINPFYSAMRKHGGIRHILARHVEGASHMAEGYTRATAGNIGVCLGTSGPAGTDMITALYSASADSIPILCITGQAPRARLHKEDFQAVDIEAIAKPVSKMAVTVREAALVPRVLQQAFHLMRSGRPGPVLVDLPFDVQVAEIEFDPDMYEPLPVYKPAASRMQIEKAVEMLIQAERPVIVAGGGVINADAAALLQQFAELTSVPVIPTLMGWGCIPDDHELMAGMVGLQTAHRYGNATLLASDMVFGIGNRFANRHTGSVEKYTEGRKIVHIDIEPTQIGRVLCPDLGIVSDAKAALTLLVEVAQEMQKAGRLPCRKEWVADCQHHPAIAPTKLTYKNGVLIASIISLLICPWKLMENQDSIYLFLDIIGGMLGPVIGVMMAHYFVVMRGQINLDELYTAPGDYKYYDNGFNLTAFSVTLVAVILSLGGKFIHFMEPLSRVSWFVGVI